MKFFLDKNIPKSLLIFLKEEGHEAKDARSIFPTETPDRKIADFAKEDKAILVTRDLGFGNVVQYPTKAHHGLIILRLPYYFIAKQITDNFKQFLKSIDIGVLEGSITIMELGKYRIRRI